MEIKPEAYAFADSRPESAWVGGVIRRSHEDTHVLLHEDILIHLLRTPMSSIPEWDQKQQIRFAVCCRQK